MVQSTDERIVATYRVETPLPIEQAAEVLAGEQSSGTFVEVPGETDQLRQRYRARVETITPLQSVSEPSLPGSRTKASARATQYHRAQIVVSWSIDNMGYNLPTLVSTLQGNLYELSQFSGLKLIDLELPPSFARVFPGPRFGIEGTRRLTGVSGRPIIGTIVKPSIGLSPEQTAQLVKQLAEAGIDFIKDDELMANPPHSPLQQRVDAVMRVINDQAQRTGKKVMYAFNISDEIDAMLRNYDHVRRAGGTAVMLSLNSVGLSGVKKVCDQGALAVHGHRNGWGMLTRHPWLGIEFPAYQKLWRLAGVDQIHVNGIANKFWESDDSVVTSIQSCLKPMFGGYRIMPVISSGQTGLQAPETFRRTATVDVLYLAGGGIMAHPGGAGAGVRALQQAWEAAVRGISIDDYARDHVELRQQLEKFGRMNHR
ncbi:ribulose-bisphosphate carboxylase large subunit family protein [Fontivita pretiosa]|uniref:ribulose-bisphosphate carboxylase large subunit family protein n=1 Tax=Fontivita pretiosa TaxID=2989684 RepID=UPI003D186189